MKKHLFSGLVFGLCLLRSLNAQTAVELDKMNRLYAGVSNPLRVAVEDVPDSQLVLLPSIGRISAHGSGYYDWTFCRFDTNIATLIIRDTIRHLTLAEKQFRLRDLPEPTAYLTSQHKSGSLPKGAFRAQAGISMVYDCCDFDARAETVSYDVWRVGRAGDVVVKHNTGARFNSEVQELIDRATVGDRYVFRNIVYKSCSLENRYSTQELAFVIR